jgi:transcription antitermination factor NusG
VSCGSHPASGLNGPRWHCATTHSQQEQRAEWSLMELGFHVYLPLLLERSIVGETHILPLFRGYVLVQFSQNADQWRRIYRCRGISGLIGITVDRPTPIAVGVVEELIARTSPRRIVDDPGADPPAVAVERAHWQDITRLSARARTDLLLRLFGSADIAA